MKITFYHPFFGIGLHLICLLIWTPAKAQNDKLESHRAFFESRDTSLNFWLDNNGMAEIIQYKKVAIQQNKLFVYLDIPDLFNWNNLAITLGQKQSIPLKNLLYYKMQFLFDVPAGNLIVKLEGKDCVVTLKRSKEGVAQLVEKKQGSPPDKIELPIGDFNGVNFSKSIEKQKSIKKLRSKIEIDLREFFKSYGTYFEEYTYESFYPSESELVVEARNITKAVLDESYFEKIQIIFNFKVGEGLVTIDYSIQAKYAAGLLWAPFESRYKDIEPKYAESLTRFGLKLKSRINQLLEKKS